MAQTLSLLNITSPCEPEDPKIKLLQLPSPNAMEMFSPRYNLIRKGSSPTAITITPNTTSKWFGRRFSVPAFVQFADRKIKNKLPTALLHQILEFIDFENPAEICSIELVCRQFKNAMNVRYTIVGNVWARLLAKNWGSSNLTHDEVLCRLNIKHVYERRHLQIKAPLDHIEEEIYARLRIPQDNSDEFDFEKIDSKVEVELAKKKLPCLLEQGKIKHYLHTIRTGYALLDIEILKERHSKGIEACDAQLIRSLFSNDEQQVLEAVTRYRRMLSVANANPSIEHVIEAKIVPQFVKILRHCRSDALKFEVTWVLTNICSGTSANVAEVVNSGVVPFLVEALYDISIKIDDVFLEQAIWALGNICGDSASFCRSVVDHEPLPVITERLIATDLSTLRVSFMRNVCWFFSNCARARPRPAFWKIRKIIDVFARTITIPDLDVLCDSLWGVSYLSENISEPGAKYLLRRISAESILRMANYNQPMVCAPAFHAIEHLIRANRYSRESLHSAGLLDSMLEILQRRRDNRRVNKMVYKIVTAVEEHWNGTKHKSLTTLQEMRAEDDAQRNQTQ
jgi:hypothetical protein